MKNSFGCIWLSMLVICLLSCNLNSRNQEPDGGPCAYDEYRVAARIISMEMLDSNSFDIIMKLDGNEFIPEPNDTLNIYMEMGRYLTKREVDSLNLKKGKALTYQLLRINTGSCNPEINTLLLETME